MPHSMLMVTFHYILLIEQSTYNFLEIYYIEALHLTFPCVEIFFHAWNFFSIHGKKIPWMEKKGFPGSLKLTLQLIGMFLKCSQPLIKELYIAENIVKDVLYLYQPQLIFDGNL